MSKQQIHIEGRRWFQKSGGNTYHGKPRYMYALSSPDASYLGLDGATFGEERQAAINALESMGVQ